MKILELISTYEGQNALWENNKGGSSYLTNVSFDLPKSYEGIKKTLDAGNIYCPWNEWGTAAIAHETYGFEMKLYLIGIYDLSTFLQHVDSEVHLLLW